MPSSFFVLLFCSGKIVCFDPYSIFLVCFVRLSSALLDLRFRCNHISEHTAKTDTLNFVRLAYISKKEATPEETKTNICTLSAQAHKISISNFDHVHVYLYFYIFYFLSHSIPLSFTWNEKLLMSFFEIGEQFFDGFSIKKSLEVARSFRKGTFLCHFQPLKKNKFTGENDKFYFDRWSNHLSWVALLFS